MTVREFYGMIGGDYDEVISRLASDQLIRKYLNMFANASDYAKLCDALTEEEWQTAFECIHNIKGNALNLGLSNLASSSSMLCESIRHGTPTCDITEFVHKVRQDYDAVIHLIIRME